MTDLPLQDKVAIVTGGASGLGRAMTLGLIAAGAHVIATAARDAKSLEQLADDIAGKSHHGKFIPIRSDVTSDADCQRVVGEAIGRFDKLDVLVNNAGRGMKYVSEQFMTEPTRFWEVEPDTWRMIIDTNVNGPFLMSRAAVPHMLANGSGRIINISMNQATMRRRGFSPYGPSKAALESETIIWAQDLADTPVTVNALLPGGAVATGMIPVGVSAEVRKNLMPPDVIVPPLIWLASDRSKGVTGRRIIATEWREEQADTLTAPGADAGWS